MFINYFLHILKYLLPFTLVQDTSLTVKGGENIKRMLLALLILFLAIANVSAEDTSGNLTVVSEGPVIDEGFISEDEGIYHVNNETFNDYIVDGIIADDDMTYEFEGTFEDLGVLSVCGNNITIVGNDASFINTGFSITGEDNTLKNLSMEVYIPLKDNDYSAIFVEGDNTLIDNVNLMYFVPSNVEAYGIQVYGSNKDKNKNFQLTNSMIYFEGHNDFKTVCNYGVFLFCADNALIYNNSIYGSLPLRNVTWDLPVSLPAIYRDIVLTVGVFECDYLNFIGNSIYTSVNEIGYASYPTLDAFYIEKSNHGLIANNTMYTEDFVTPKDIENYLYGLDIYGYLTDLTIIGNDFTVNTTGGTYAHGTAYPIQLTGPLDGVKITENLITSQSNGPNIGIYSQNTAGYTSLNITKNNILVTGWAGTHEWALVAGIEGQDSDDYIADNIIEVHSIDEVSEDDNLYGISYRQSTDGEHSFNVVNNTVFSEGYYAVAVLDAQNSNFDSNVLYTDNEESIGKNSLKVFDEDASSYASNENVVRNIWDYLAGKYNSQDGGEEFVEEIPVNVNNITNNVDASNADPSGNNNPSYNTNPLIPSNPSNPEAPASPDTPDYRPSPSILVPDRADGDVNSNPINTNVPDRADGDPTYVKPTINYEDWDGNDKKYVPSQNTKPDSSSSNDVKREYENWDGNGKLANTTSNSDGSFDADSSFTLKDLLDAYVSSNTQGGSADTESYNGRVSYNNTRDNSPSISGDEGALGQSQSSASESSDSGSAGSNDAGSGGSKVYEVLKDILENNSNTIIPSVGLVLIALFLLVVGYRRKEKSDF